EQLEANLLHDGCRDPLSVWNNGKENILLDGHNRYNICTAHGIEYDLAGIEGITNRNDAKLWIIDNQQGRRNLNPYQRTRLALAKKNIIAARAKEHESDGGKGLPISGDPIRTDKEVAKLANVGHDTVHKVEVIELYADDKLKAKLESGEESIHGAFKQVRKKREYQRREQQKTEAARLHPG
ncbi:unnamed protein product, partial [marine sediment metagenome]